MIARDVVVDRAWLGRFLGREVIIDGRVSNFGTNPLQPAACLQDMYINTQKYPGEPSLLNPQPDDHLWMSLTLNGYNVILEARLDARPHGQYLFSNLRLQGRTWIEVYHRAGGLSFGLSQLRNGRCGSNQNNFGWRSLEDVHIDKPILDIQDALRRNLQAHPTLERAQYIQRRFELLLVQAIVELRLGNDLSCPRSTLEAPWFAELFKCSQRGHAVPAWVEVQAVTLITREVAKQLMRDCVDICDAPLEDAA